MDCKYSVIFCTYDHVWCFLPDELLLDHMKNFVQVGFIFLLFIVLFVDSIKMLE